MSGADHGRVLSPYQAVHIANAAYKMLHHPHVAKGEFPKNIQDSFDLPEQTPFDGKTGTAKKQVTTGFGIVAMGKPNKGKTYGQDFSRDALVAIRGTVTSHDWETDFHAGAQFIDGKLVHSGFFKVYRSILTPISHFFHQHKPQRVHVVGHSLGGALSVLVANWIQKHTSAEPVLYTFGAPRVGGSAFAKHFTAKIKPRNIYRVYHANDPVPMVPVWPFKHVPDPGRDYCVKYSGYGENDAVNPLAHRLGSYMTSMQGHGTWGSFPHKVNHELTDAEIRGWILTNVPHRKRFTAKDHVYLEQAEAYMYRLTRRLDLDKEELNIMKSCDQADLAVMAKSDPHAVAATYKTETSEEMKKLWKKLHTKVRNERILEQDLAVISRMMTGRAQINDYNTILANKVRQALMWSTMF